MEENIEMMYAQIATVWKKDESVRNGRSNIFSLNLILLQLMFMYGGQDYFDAHAPDLKVPGRKKFREIFRTFTRIAIRIGFIPCCPVSILTPKEINKK